MTADLAAAGTRTDTAAAVAPRFHDLDALRGVAMILGIVLHGALFLLAVEEWPLTDPGATEGVAAGYGIMIAAIHGFRMPIFFLLSGFFTALLWQRYGLGTVLGHRLRRVGLPLAIGAVTIVPATTGLLALSGGEEFAPLHPLTWLLAWTYDLDHLWFLWYLLALVALFALLVKLGLTFRHRWLWWGLIPLSLLPQLLMNWLGGETGSPVINPQALGWYAMFFLMGAFMQQRGLVVGQGWAWALAPALLIVFPLSLIFLDAEEDGGAMMMAAACQLAYAWLMCFGLMGLFRRIAGRERFWVRYLSDAAYWMYLAHMPLVVAGQMLLVNWPLNVHLKFGLLCAGVSLILLVSYQLGVRYTFVGNGLNGRRARRMRPA